MEDYCFTELVKYLREGEMPIGLGDRAAAERVPVLSVTIVAEKPGMGVL